MQRTHSRIAITFIISMSMATSPSIAEVRSLGDVAPAPNADGGTISGALRVGVGTAAGETLLGTMNIDSDTSLTVGDGIIGDRVGANGVVSVEGRGAIWGSDDDLLVGNAGYGELSIRDQGWVTNSDDFSIGMLEEGRGWVELTGTATFLNVGDVLTVGNEGTGSLSASDNARVVSRSAIVGADSRGIGTVEISEGASWRVIDALTVGNSGTGSLQVNSGGLVESDRGVISANPSGHGQVTVEGAGSIWLVRNDLAVGDRDSGELRISELGTVQVNDNLTVQPFGEVQLEDGRLIANSIVNAGVISGGGRVEGLLTNGPTGSIRADSEDTTLLFSSTTTNSGAIDVIGGAAEFQRAVTNGATGSISGHDGVLRFSGGMVNNGRLGFTTGSTDIFGDVQSTATGSIRVGGEGTATFHDDLTIAGTVDVEPEASFVVLGDTTLAATATFSLTGLAADPQPNGEPSIDDPINIAASISLNGTLSLQASNDPDASSTPALPGESVTISLASADQLLGAFERVDYELSTLNMDFVLSDDGRSFRSYDPAADELGMFRTLTYTDTNLDITNYWALGGDTDGDRDVDFADFLVVSGNFGDSVSSWLEGDFDGDNIVAFSDFLLLSDNFGTGGIATPSAVPEPSSFVLFGFSVIGLLIRKRR